MINNVFKSQDLEWFKQALKYQSIVFGFLLILFVIFKDSIMDILKIPQTLTNAQAVGGKLENTVFLNLWFETLVFTWVPWLGFSFLKRNNSFMFSFLVGIIGLTVYYTIMYAGWLVYTNSYCIDLANESLIRDLDSVYRVFTQLVFFLSIAVAFPFIIVNLNFKDLRILLYLLYIMISSFVIGIKHSFYFFIFTIVWSEIWFQIIKLTLFTLAKIQTQKIERITLDDINKMDKILS
jgi:hypothetical protein